MKARLRQQGVCHQAHHGGLGGTDLFVENVEAGFAEGIKVQAPRFAVLLYRPARNVGNGAAQVRSSSRDILNVFELPDGGIDDTPHRRVGGNGVGHRHDKAVGAVKADPAAAVDGQGNFADILVVTARLGDDDLPACFFGPYGDVGYHQVCVTAQDHVDPAHVLGDLVTLAPLPVFRVHAGVGQEDDDIHFLPVAQTVHDGLKLPIEGLKVILEVGVVLPGPAGEGYRPLSGGVVRRGSAQRPHNADFKTVGGLDDQPAADRLDGVFAAFIHVGSKQRVRGFSVAAEMDVCGHDGRQLALLDRRLQSPAEELRANLEIVVTEGRGVIAPIRLSPEDKVNTAAFPAIASVRNCLIIVDFLASPPFRYTTPPGTAEGG
ncbi:MAG: hypothetical protein NTZ24_14890 [Deltaproteobacteria bacterium]|nr:hypothetical protein [Deltaproteobacteria bacterium]